MKFKVKLHAIDQKPYPRFENKQKRWAGSVGHIQICIMRKGCSFAYDLHVRVRTFSQNWYPVYAHFFPNILHKLCKFVSLKPSVNWLQFEIFKII